MIPAKPADGDWRAWVDKHYPFDPRWQRFLQRRTEFPRPGSADQLEDLRGVPRDLGAAILAELWFNGIENTKQIESEQRAARELLREKERRRMIRIAGLAFDGKLGSTRDEQDGARAIAQQFLSDGPLDRLSYETLRDWEKMHRYAREIAAGGNPKRPTLSRDRKAQQEQRREMQDVEDAIDAVPGGRPRQVEQRSLGQW
jgi:hypothetical protein